MPEQSLKPWAGICDAACESIVGGQLGSYHRGVPRLYLQKSPIYNQEYVVQYCDNVPLQVAEGCWDVTLMPVGFKPVNLLAAEPVAEYDPADGSESPVGSDEKLEVSMYVPSDLDWESPAVLFSDDHSQLLRPNLVARSFVALRLGWVVVPTWPDDRGIVRGRWAKFNESCNRGYFTSFANYHPVQNDVETVKGLLSKAGFTQEKVRRGVLICSRADGASELTRRTGDELGDLWDVAAMVYGRDDVFSASPFFKASH